MSTGVAVRHPVVVRNPVGKRIVSSTSMVAFAMDDRVISLDTMDVISLAMLWMLG